jgi:hypothetical protein
MQRVGRINRVGTEHENIYVFNFFPTAQANAHLPLEENIKMKIQAFHDTLGEDFKYLSEDEEVSSHNLYEKLNSKDMFDIEDGGENSELRYLKIIRDIRDNDEELFDKIKKLPRKCKSGREIVCIENSSTLTFMRKGSLKKFYISTGENTEEVLFMNAVKYLETTPDTSKIKLSKEYYDHLNMNKESFESSIKAEKEIIIDKNVKIGNDAKIIKLLKAYFKI